MEKESAIDEMGAISTAYIANSLYNVPMNDGDLVKILNEKGITREDYDSNPELKEQYVVNTLMT